MANRPTQLQDAAPPPADPGMDESDHAYLAPLFLGPSGENGALFENLLTSFLRDHVYWRRNFHPEDAPSIPLATHDRRDFREATARLEQALYRLSADLKRSTPAFAPRYIGHMMSDPLLPALLGQLVTTLYNPNNIASEAAPVTLDLEIDVGRQLATMIGMDADNPDGPRAWGHITSGGTVANYEALWLLRAARLFPPALAAALAGEPAAEIETTLPGRPLLGDLDPWTLANFTVEQASELNERFRALLDRLPPAERRRLAGSLAAERHEQLGPGFFDRHGIEPPVVIVPAPAPERLRQLGDYILEGSKPGAAAAAVWLTHAVVPLDCEHFGRLVRQSVRAAEALYDRLCNMAGELSPICQLSIPVEPDTNLICLALRPAGDTSLRAANDLTRRVYRHLSVDSTLPVQTRQFVGSHTAMRRASLAEDSAARLARAIGVDPATFVTDVSDPAMESDHIFLIRHTLMNPWLRLVQDGASYLDRYCDYLRSLIERERIVHIRGHYVRSETVAAS